MIQSLYGLAVLIVATVFGALDRQMTILVADPISRSLGLSDRDIGLALGLGLTLCSGLAAVPIGWLADKYDRRRLLCLCVLGWSAATAACGLADSFWTLFLATVLMGLGESGVTPIVWGLLPQVVPAQRRALANGIFMLAANLGSGLGMGICGWVVEWIHRMKGHFPEILAHLADWRLAFCAVALPGPVIALLILLIRTLEAGSPSESAQNAPAPALWGYLRGHAMTLATVFAGIGFLMFGVAASTNWIPTVASRSFGAQVQSIGAYTGTAYLAGTLAGGAIYFCTLPFLKARFAQSAAIWAYTIALLWAAGMTFLLMWARSTQMLFVLFGIQYGVTIVASTYTPTLLQDMAPAALRSRVVGLAVTTGYGISALGPLAVGAVSDRLASSPGHLQVAVSAVGVTGFLVGAALMFLGRKSFSRTVGSVDHA